MFKKVLNIFVFFATILTTISPSYGYDIFDGEAGLDLYESIDKGIDEIKVQMLTRELKGQDPEGTIIEELNKLALQQKLPMCFIKKDGKDMTVGELKSVVNGDAEILYNYIENNNEGGEKSNDTRKSEADRIKGEMEAVSREIDAMRSSGDLSNLTQKEKEFEGLEATLGNIKTQCFAGGSIPNSIFNRYLEVIKDFYAKSSYLANTKTNELYEIARIGLYSDGIRENSSFDLISDIEDIDKILFTEYIPYVGVNVGNFDDFLENVFEGDNLDEAKSKSIYGEIVDAEDDIGNIEYTDPSQNYIKDWGSDFPTTESYACEIPNQTGLDLSAIGLHEIIGGTGGIAKGDIDYSYNPNIRIPEEEEGGEKKDKYESVWPCNEFFCIQIGFKNYTHYLLGGSNSIAVDYILETSNKHLKKFANTSLIQSRMTTNNFQFGLRDIDFSELLHIGFQISYEPPPILNFTVSDKGKSTGEKSENTGEFSTYKEMLAVYYKDYGLNYERQNDITKFLDEENELKSILDTRELLVNDFPNIQAEKDSYMLDWRRHAEITEELAIHSNLSEDMEDFYLIFSELEGFVVAMRDYSQKASQIINKMTEIPQTK